MLRSHLVCLVIRVLVLVSGDVTGSIWEVLPSGNALPLPRVVEPLLARPRVLAGVCQPLH